MKKHDQSGSILLSVLIIGTVCSLLLCGAVLGPVYTETRAVETQLGELRARWAIIGGFRYALSRTYRHKLCPNAVVCPGSTKITDSNKAAALQNYLNEISSYQTWTYPDEVSSYFLKTALTATPDDTAGRNTYSGHLMIKGSYQSGQSTLGVLNGLTTRTGPLEVRFCAGVSWSGASCGTLSSDNGGLPTSFYSVKRLTRLLPGS